MANLILTNLCNLSCPFCFASEYHEGARSDSGAFMSLEVYQRQLTFLGDQPVRFCGGEPTLHPQFARLLDLALARRGREVFIMSNGLWPRAVREQIKALPRRDAKRVGYLFNILPGQYYSDSQRAQLHETLASVRRERVTLGVTLYEAPYRFDHLFDLARRYRFGRVRYSVAAPNVTDASSWNIDAARDFPQLAQVVYELTMRARQLGLYVHSDCGYLPPCMFSAGQLAAMYPEGSGAFAEAFSCNGPTDIGPSGEAWRCYGLYSTMRAATSDFVHIGALSDHFARRTAETTYGDLFDACGSCDLRERYACAGGCYALRSVDRMRQRAEAALVSIGDDPIFHAATARRCAERLVAADPRDPTAIMFQEADGDWAKLPLTPWEAEILAACDGVRTVEQIIETAQRAAPDQRQGASRSAARVLRRFYEQGAIELEPAGDLTPGA